MLSVLLEAATVGSRNSYDCSFKISTTLRTPRILRPNDTEVLHEPKIAITYRGTLLYANIMVHACAIQGVDGLTRSPLVWPTPAPVIQGTRLPPLRAYLSTNHSDQVVSNDANPDDFRIDSISPCGYVVEDSSMIKREIEMFLDSSLDFIFRRTIRDDCLGFNRILLLKQYAVVDVWGRAAGSDRMGHR